MKPFLVAATLTLTTAWFVSLGLAQDGSGGNRGTPPPVSRRTAVTVAAPIPSGNLLAAISGGPTADAYLMSVSPFSVLLTLAGHFPANLSGLSNLPGTAIFSMTGGMGDGGNLYYSLPNGSFVGVGPSGFGAVPGLAWNPTGTVLYGTAAVSVPAAGLIFFPGGLPPASMIGPFGGGIGGIDAIAFQPTTGTLFGSTGFFYDGSPGDEIVMNPATGAAAKTGVMIPEPPCTVAGMAFDDGGTGYISIGCGSGLGGNIYSWNPTTNVITLLGNANGSTKSVTDIEAIF